MLLKPTNKLALEQRAVGSRTAAAPLAYDLPARATQGASSSAYSAWSSGGGSGRSVRSPAQFGRSSTAVRAVQAPQAERLTVHTLSSIDLDDHNSPLAYEIVQGPLVRWTRPGAGISPPTAVMVHGILGSKRNMHSFARMLLEGFPSWQILLVDLRCHGDSVALPDAPERPHTVHTAASDVIALLRNLKLFPHTLIGHSFGGKVVMGMIQQFGKVLPRPVQVWVLDSLPGEIRAGTGEGGVGDHPAHLIDFLRSMPLPIASRSQAVSDLTRAGFSPGIAAWAATNLRPIDGRTAGAASSTAPLTWSFDLDGIRELFSSYERTDLFPLLEQPPQGLKLDFVKAERSNFRWGGEDEQRIVAAGHRVHLLRQSGHWVHTDNPVGLFDVMAPSFGQVDLQQRRSMRPS